ncbi:CHAP domain-containing protein [Kitasatospora sp. NPDC056138]|uniref:CHAP domain-containing protein n=1 Tax=Kitasatospora sp. NPDC056138 TaxID=3345724 RepID=UPI0035D662EE
MENIRTTLTVVGAALAVAVPLVGATSAPAFAASRDGVCDAGEFCYYYNSDEAGSISDFTGSLGDYGTTQPSCYEFKSAGNGQGVCVKNNAASVWNRTGQTVRVHYNSGYAGAYQDFAPGAKGNLNATLKNNNASHQFLGGTGGNQTPVDDYDHSGHGFYPDQCTAFAAFRVATRLGISDFGNSWGGTSWFNANTWDDSARRAGLTVNTTPTVGAIAVNDVHGKFGHVAYVNAVYSDGSFDIEEYNWNNPTAYGTRSHVHVSNAQSDFQWMIHF